MMDKYKSLLLPPPRIRFPNPLHFFVYLAFILLIVNSVKNVSPSPVDLAHGIPHIVRIIREMLPPSFDRVDSVINATFETLQMALVGTLIGIAISFPLSILASKVHTPHQLLYYTARVLIAFLRTVPDIIWALIFVVSVGLGPFAGTLAIMVDTIGFCGRFFAEAMEEVDKEPQEALKAIGASRIDIIFCVVVPMALPSFTNTILYSLEKSTRSSVILGLVGAGGIGIELKVAMDMFQYQQASTIILAIFLLVFIVEQISSIVRSRII
jgi:phosphonate transport system permease protein